ncbi:MAG: GNAT family N-acetyltransferase [Bacillota bacterium]
MHSLHEGKLIKENRLYSVHTLSMLHIEEILSLQDIVVADLEDKTRLQPLSRGEYEYILKGNGVMIGAFLEQELIAFRALLKPEIDDEHLGLDIGLNVDELNQVIYQEISIVHPLYRGNRLQQVLGTIIMEELNNLPGDINYISCTVAPFNIPSLKDKFTQGMEIAALKNKYGDQIRYIFVKEVNKSSAQTDQKRLSTSMDDFPTQQSLLTTGWRGIGMKILQEKYHIEFVKFQ